MKPTIKQFNGPIYENHMEPEGFMPDCVASSAAWNFYIMAHTAIDKIPKQKTFEGDTDITVNLRDLARSALAAYNLPRPEEGGLDLLFNPDMIDCARREAKRCKLHWDSRIDAWLDSGGRAYNIITREPPE